MDLLARSISVFWDMETCPPTSTVDPYYIEKNLQNSLNKAKVEGQIVLTAYGVQGMPQDIVNAMKEATLELIEFAPHQRKAIGLRITERILALHANADNPVTCVLISGDEEFADLCQRLNQRPEYNIFLVHPHDQPSQLQNSCLVCSCKKIWSFERMLRGEGPF